MAGPGSASRRASSSSDACRASICCPRLGRQVVDVRQQRPAGPRADGPKARPAARSDPVARSRRTVRQPVAPRRASPLRAPGRSPPPRSGPVSAVRRTRRRDKAGPPKPDRAAGKPEPAWSAGLPVPGTSVRLLQLAARGRLSRSRLQTADPRSFGGPDRSDPTAGGSGGAARESAAASCRERGTASCSPSSCRASTCCFNWGSGHRASTRIASQQPAQREFACTPGGRRRQAQVLGQQPVTGRQVPH